MKPRRARWLAGLFVLPLGLPAPVRADGADAKTREICARLREGQKGLTTARAKCELTTTLSILDASVLQEGTVCWMRKPDGSVRQRWDLRSEDAEGNPHAETYYVFPDHILYYREDKVDPFLSGPLRAPDIFHHPVFGGLVFTVPSEESLRDPEFAISLLDEDVHENSGGGSGDDRNGSEDHGEETTRRPGGYSLMLKPRSPQWKGLLDEILIVFDAGHRHVVQALYRENNNNQHTVIFRAFEPNPKLDEKMFDPPAEPEPGKEK